MTATIEMRTLAKRRWTIGCVALVLTSLIAIAIFRAEKNLNEVPSWGAVALCGTCLGIFSVLMYHFRGWKSFGECMHVSLMPVAVLYIVLGLLLLVGMFASLVLRGVEAMVLLPLVLLIYFGGALYLALLAALLCLSSCAGGAFIFGAMRVMKLVAEAGRPQSR